MAKKRKDIKWFFACNKAWYIKWWVWLLSLIIILVIPFVINIVYKFGTSTGKGYYTLWEAKDVLAFYGSLLAAIGTIVLGVVAIYQNKQAYKVNSAVQKLQQAQFVSMVSLKKLELNAQSVKYPDCFNVKFEDPEIVNLTLDGFDTYTCFHIDTEFFNDSNYPIVEIAVHEGSPDNDNCMMYGIRKFFEMPIYIHRNEALNLRFIVPSETLKSTGKNQLFLNIWFGNIFDYKTKAVVSIENILTTNKSVTYKYRLAKFSDVKPKEEA